MPTPEEVLDFWLGDAAQSPQAAAGRVAFWFGVDPAVDAAVRRRFGGLPAEAVAGALDAWAQAPRSALARVIVLDQLPRNLHRGSPEAFAFDAAGLAAARDARGRGFEEALAPLEAAFLLLPFQHAEDPEAQEEGVRAYEALIARVPEAWRGPLGGFLHSAREHRDVVVRFGRFPHRNAILGRSSRPEERAFLEANATTWGQAAASAAPAPPPPAARAEE